ncbi:MAG: PAS domain-containing protein, partial [Pseudomonadota bacterium]
MALDRIDRLGRASDSVLDQPFELVGALLEAHDHAFSVHTSLRDAVDAVDAGRRAVLLEAVAVHERSLRASLAILARRHQATPHRLAPLLEAMGEWSAVRADAIDLLTRGRRAEAQALLSEKGERSFRRQHEVLGSFLAEERDMAARLRSEADEARHGAEVASMFLAILAGAASAAALLGYAVFTRAHRPLMRLRTSLLALADGDGTVEVPHTDAPGTIGLVARAVARLKRVMAERDNAIAALRLSEDRLKAALSIAPMAVFNLDRQLRYTWIYNPQVPIPAEDFIGRTGAEFFEAEGYASRAALCRRVLATGRTAVSEIVLRLRGSDEDRHFDQMVAPVFGPDGTVAGLTCAAIEVTDRVRAARQLEHAIAQARRADDAKARFLAAASHDLRQPLQALRLFMDLMDQRLTGGRDRQIMGGALSALSAAEDLMRNYLDVSVLEAGILRPNPTDIQIGEMLRDVVAECADQAAEKGIALRLA